MKNLLVAAVGLIALCYLLNIGTGIIELIPDAVPLLGNLDEAAAAAILLSCLRYYGIDLTTLFMRRKDGGSNNVRE